MRDGVEQRGAQLVGTPQDLRLGRFFVQSVAFDRQSDLSRRGREQPIIGLGKRARFVGEQQRPDAAVANADRYEMHVVARASWPSWAERCAPSGRARRAVSGDAPGPRCNTRPAPTARPSHTAQRRRITSIEAGDLTGRTPQLDCQGGQVQLAAEPLGDRRERRVDVAFAEQADHVIQHDGLALALAALRGRADAGRPRAGR